MVSGETLRVVRLELEAAAMKYAIAWLLLTTAAIAQQPFPGVPPGWSLFIVHAPWCAPCNQFRRDYHTIDQFRNKLETGFAVKSVEWDRPSEQRFARRFAIASLPGFIVFRDGIHQQSFSGYNGDWTAFLQRLNLDVDGTGQTPGGGTEGPARPVTPAPPVAPMLPEITDLRLQIDKLRDQLKQQAASAASALKAPAATDIPRQVETPKPPSLPTLAISAVGHSADAGVGADWAKVGAAALTLLAPQVALPAGAIGAAATVFQMLRKRRQAMQQQQPQRQTIVERPVVINSDTVPPPAQVVTQNQYVPVERDTHREAWAFASSAYVKKYPGSEAMIGALNHMMEQFISPQQKAG